MTDTNETAQGEAVAVKDSCVASASCPQEPLAVERVTGVALLAKDGRMWALPKPARHGTLFALAAFQGADPEPCEQGFYTSSGRFIGRIGALAMVRDNKQPLRNPDAHTQLYSEDLW